MGTLLADITNHSYVPGLQESGNCTPDSRPWRSLRGEYEFPMPWRIQAYLGRPEDFLMPKTACLIFPTQVAQDIIPKGSPKLIHFPSTLVLPQHTDSFFPRTPPFPHHTWIPPTKCPCPLTPGASGPSLPSAIIPRDAFHPSPRGTCAKHPSHWQTPLCQEQDPLFLDSGLAGVARPLVAPML